MEPMASGGDLSCLHVVVPLRTVSGGKLRLGEALDPEERETLIVGMLRHELTALGTWRRATAVHVVSPDPRVPPIVEAAGARAIRQHGEGLNAGIVQARAITVALGATALLVLPGDLPLMDVAALDRLLDATDAALAAGGGGPVVALVPADARGGTNGLLCSPPGVIEPCFGPSSLECHLLAARKAGASVQLVVDAVLGFDLDTPEDLDRLDLGRLTELEALGSAVLAV